MRFVSTKIHGFMDYFIGALLITCPWIFQFYEGDAASWTLIVMGSMLVLYSAVTDYELGLAKTLPMKNHLTLDLISGIVLAFSPWFFDFSETMFLPHLIIGISESGLSFVTRTTPEFGTTYKAQQD